MKRGYMLAGLLAAAGICGCLPEKRVVWSPDGRWAAVMGDDGVYLSDRTGQLGPRLAEDVSSVAWLPDSRGLLLSRAQPAASWDDVAGVLPGERRREVESRAAALGAELAAYTGDWSQFPAASLEGLTDGEKSAALAHVRDRPAEGLVEKLGERWKELQAHQASVHALELFAVHADGSAERQRTLARAVDGFAKLRVAPHGRAAAFLWPRTDNDGARRLMVIALEDAAVPREVAGRAALFPDWTPDGQALVYATTVLPPGPKGDELRLGTIARRAVAGEDGALRAELPEAQELAGTVFQPETRVRCLRDGRVLFATLPVQLPCTAADMPERAALFAVDPGRQPGVVRVLPQRVEAELPDALVLFEVSPDEQLISVPGGDGRVAVVELARGEVWKIVGEGEAGPLRTEPAWRSADELTVAQVPAPVEQARRAEIMVARLDRAAGSIERTVLSATWPNAVAGEFLALPDSAKPASAPAGEAPGR